MRTDASPNVDSTVGYIPVSVHGDLRDLGRAEAGNIVVYDKSYRQGD